MYNMHQHCIDLWYTTFHGGNNVTKNAQIAVRLPAALRDWLENQAAADHRTLSNYVVILLERAKAQAEQGDKEAAAGDNPA